MGILYTIKNRLFGAEKRRLKRNPFQAFLSLRVVLGTTKYRLKDFSQEGLALFNDHDGGILTIGQTYPCTVTVNDAPRISIQIIVRRLDADSVGCEVVDLETFQNFIDQYLETGN